MKNTHLTTAAALLSTGLLSAGQARAELVELDVALGKPIVMSNQQQTAYLKVGLTALEALKKKERAPVNLAIVLDRSSSMNGEKIAKAKEAAVMVVDRLSGDDIVSIITYDSRVEVLVPATKVRQTEAIKSRIFGIRPRGSTALFAGVSKGIQEVRKFLDRNRVNRVILLSDGQANVGPSSPNELGRLGAACAKEGISVSTIGLGLGYNEDLMVKLAESSDGNHGFAATAEELAQLFDYELGDVLSVVAQEVSVKLNMPEGVRPIRILNRDGEIFGREVVFSMNQLYQKQEKYVLVEVELPPGKAGTMQTVANVDVSYANIETGKTDHLSGRASVQFTSEPQQVATAENRDVMIAAIEALAVEKNEDALALRDKGSVVEAEKALEKNAAFLEESAERYRSPRLNRFGKDNREDAKNLRGHRWKQRRKKMKKRAYELQTQQSY